MKNQPDVIPQFDLPAPAKVGVLIRRIEHRDDQGNRVTASPTGIRTTCGCSPCRVTPP